MLSAFSCRRPSPLTSSRAGNKAPQELLLLRTPRPAHVDRPMGKQDPLLSPNHLVMCSGSEDVASGYDYTLSLSRTSHGEELMACFLACPKTSFLPWTATRAKTAIMPAGHGALDSSQCTLLHRGELLPISKGSMMIMSAPRHAYMPPG
jgi:hypothetical protein